MKKLNGIAHSDVARAAMARARWDKMTLAQRSEWVLSEVAKVLEHTSNRLNPGNLPISDATPENFIADSFRLELWGKKCADMADEIREECRVKSIIKPGA